MSLYLYEWGEAPESVQENADSLEISARADRNLWPAKKLRREQFFENLDV
jgi:hypothetical protein